MVVLVALKNEDDPIKMVALERSDLSSYYT